MGAAAVVVPLAVLLGLAAITLLVARRVPGLPRSAVAIAVCWEVGLLGADAVAWSAALHGADPLTSFGDVAVVEELPALLTVAATLLLAVRLHQNWMRAVADAWLLAGTVALLVWTVLLAVQPDLSPALLLGALGQMALAYWLLVWVLTVRPGLAPPVAHPPLPAGTVQPAPHPSLRNAGTLLVGVTGIRALATTKILIGLATGSGFLLWSALVLLVLSHVWLLIEGAALLGPLLRRTTPRQIGSSWLPLQLPYAVVLVLGTAIAVLWFTVPSAADAAGFVLAGLVLLVLAAGHMLTAAHNERLLRTMGDRERHFRSLVRDATEVIGLCTADGRIEYLSPRARAVLGISPVDAVGTSLSDLLGLPAAVVDSELEMLLADGGVTVLDSSPRGHRGCIWRPWCRCAPTAWSAPSGTSPNGSSCNAGCTTSPTSTS
ncbi:hypothetical protein GIS00_16460 [Nakamurella sp. YIM 132087]|uniref:PAS domain-containing protein n=1 Tax=Nakamurella alba TaxID=2665158 RepID=A0A7K1FMY3_9ACTN|nr:PAS domain-containing protein [Nakamurella alba]MTD15527.1 hypothetical protein [Nakamurella alba]